MGAAQKILTIMGVIYTIIGGGVLIAMIFSAMIFTSGVPLVMYLLPAVFLLLGIGFLVGVYINVAGKRNIVKKGTRYPAKIYGYMDNTSVVVNGRFPQNAKVHYFDNHGIEREAVIPTSFTKGSNEYPIGMTIDIYEYNGKYGFDKKSVRDEILYREEELMDDKPINPGAVKLIAVTCPNCASTYQATQGYSNRCPYCGSYQNV